MEKTVSESEYSPACTKTRTHGVLEETDRISETSPTRNVERGTQEATG